jgi:hypothetical protein
MLLTVVDSRADAVAEGARRMLLRRWPSVETVVVDKAPVEGIRALSIGARSPSSSHDDQRHDQIHTNRCPCVGW